MHTSYKESLRGNYERMDDADLLNILRDWGDLTSTAQRLLAVELEKRGITDSQVSQFEARLKAWDMADRASRIATQVYGCGTALFNYRNRRPDGSYLVTKWVTVFWIPILSLGDMRIKPATLANGRDGYVILKEEEPRADRTGNMPSEWIQKLIERKKAQRECASQDAEAAGLGASAAPRMFKLLRDRVEQDVAEFNSLSPQSQFVYEFNPSEKFTVARTIYPAIWLDVVLEGAVLVCRGKEKRGASTGEVTFMEESIFVIAGRRLEADVFEIGGIEYGDASKVAEFLLKPLFDAVL